MRGRAWTRDKSSMVGSKLEFTARSTTHVGTDIEDEKAGAGRMNTDITGTLSNTSSERAGEIV